MVELMNKRRKAIAEMKLKRSGATLESLELKKLKSSHNITQPAELQETTSISAGATIAAGDPIPAVTYVSADFSISTASSIPAVTPIAAGVSTTAGASGSASEASVPIIELLDSLSKDTSLPLYPETEEQDKPLRKSSRKKSIARKRTLPKKKLVRSYRNKSPAKMKTYQQKQNTLAAGMTIPNKNDVDEDLSNLAIPLMDHDKKGKKMLQRRFASYRSRDELSSQSSSSARLGFINLELGLFRALLFKLEIVDSGLHKPTRVVPPIEAALAYWAIKACNMDLRKAGANKFMQINKLDELRLDAYESLISYKERMKRWHDKRIKTPSDKVLLVNSRIRLFPDALDFDGYDDVTLEDEGGVTLYLMRRTPGVLRSFMWTTLG
uniref:Uncharacterized protein n=1 Tax=Tanacetum cinerariifolium TaxID=118510 RepID=A0A6L2NG48_TANCI|nr:hypothetical protein [Tanacetum cinerariifolium]